MIASHLAALLAPFAQLANKHALSDVYRCVEIGADYVRGAAQFGIMDAALKLGIPETVWLDTNIFASVLKSLPGKEEVKFEVKGSVLEWECGLATGKLAILAKQAIPQIEGSIPDAAPWSPTDAFTDALELGALACGSMGTASAGVYGVLFDNRDDLALLSSDNVTVASCRVSDRVADFPERVTFSPEAIAMLRTVLNGITEGAAISLTEKALYCVNKSFRLLLKPIPPIRHDLRALVKQFADGDSVAPLPREALQAFIRRVGALAETKADTFVNLAVAEGALSLSFAQGAASADEYYLVEGLEIPEIADIKLDAPRLARALGSVEELVLDHIGRTGSKSLVLRGKTPLFHYVIAGKGE